MGEIEQSDGCPVEVMVGGEWGLETDFASTWKIADPALDGDAADVGRRSKCSRGRARRRVARICRGGDLAPEDNGGAWAGGNWHRPSYAVILHQLAVDFDATAAETCLRQAPDVWHRAAKLLASYGGSG